MRIVDRTFFLSTIKSKDEAKQHVSDGEFSAIVPLNSVKQVSRIVRNGFAFCGQTTHAGFFNGDEFLSCGIPIVPGIVRNDDFVSKVEVNPVQ